MEKLFNFIWCSVLLSSIAMAQGKEKPAQINNRPPASVETITVRINNREQMGKLSAEIRNNSKKTITVIGLEYRAVSEVQGYKVHFAISGPENKVNILPNEIKSIEQPEETNSYTILRTAPIGDVVIVLVNFEDGSVWEEDMIKRK